MYLFVDSVFRVLVYSWAHDLALAANSVRARRCLGLAFSAGQAWAVFLECSSSCKAFSAQPSLSPGHQRLSLSSDAHKAVIFVEQPVSNARRLVKQDRPLLRLHRATPLGARNAFRGEMIVHQVRVCGLLSPNKTPIRATGYAAGRVEQIAQEPSP